VNSRATDLASPTQQEQRPSLRSELTRTLAVVSAVWMLATFLTMAFGIRHEVDDLLDDALQESAEVLYGSLVLHVPELPARSGDTLPAPAHEERLVWQIVGPGPKVLLHSHKAPTTPLLDTQRPGFHATNPQWRVYAMAMPSAGQMLLVGRSAGERLEARYEAIAVVGLSGLLVSLLCALWMRQRVVQDLQPLHRLSRQIQAYDPMQPRTAPASASHQDFVELREAILQLGGRLARRVEQEQAFAAHAAHALRTPLAGMDAQLATAMKELPPAAWPRLARVREAVNRLTRVTTSLLIMFRSNAAPDLQPVWMMDIVDHLAIDGLAVTVEQQDALTADANLLAAVLANLLDNARRAGATQCRIVVQAADFPMVVALCDDGPGLAQARIDSILSSATASTDQGHSGLGIKLADLVARIHKGRLEIMPAPPPDGGLCVRLLLWEQSRPPQAHRKAGHAATRVDGLGERAGGPTLKPARWLPNLPPGPPG
jgi:signal transduction histidine kinase